jgi:hypothetical protein
VAEREPCGDRAIDRAKRLGAHLAQQVGGGETIHPAGRRGIRVRSQIGPGDFGCAARLRGMRIGVVVPMALSDGTGQMPSWPGVHAFTEGAEALGLQSVWVCDHFVSNTPGRQVEGIHEGWTILSALAASTSRVELGQLVMRASFRNPALLAKMAATADAISGGRLLLGLGAGWYDPEYEAFGYPTDHRVGRFEEALQIRGLRRPLPPSVCTSWTQTRPPRATAMTSPLQDPSTSLRARSTLTRCSASTMSSSYSSR